MNIRIIGVVFVVSILLLLIFQAVWLYNTYHIEKERIRARINLCLENAVHEELIIRENREWNEADILSYNSNIDEYGSDIPSVEFDVKDGLKTNFFQQLMLFAGHPIRISVLDSVFNRNLIEAKCSVDYLLCYKDSVGIINEYSGELALKEDERVFVSSLVPIVSSNYIVAYASISIPVVLKQMIGLTIASFLMLLVLLIILTFQIRYAYNQYRFNKLREDFSQTLIHDLKSPLNTIYIAFYNYQNGLFAQNPEFGKKSVGIAIEQVLNIQALVDKILTTARLEERKMKVDRSEIDLPVLIRKQTERYELSANKPVRFNTSFDLHNTPIYVDAFLFEQALSNLIDNAIKYSGERVTICIECETKQGKLYVRVMDDGLGISEKDQLKIFTKFERGAAVGSKSAKGFGLGLSYVQQVAIAHQGTIGLSSIKGKGSKFIIVLPLLLQPVTETTDNLKIDE